jgi:PAS domain S-box-containing protein
LSGRIADTVAILDYNYTDSGEFMASRPEKPNIADLVPALIAIYDLETGEYRYVNQSIRKMLGYKPEDLLKGGIRFVVSLVHPDDIDEVMAKNDEAVQKIQHAKPGSLARDPIVSFEYRMRHKNGSYVWPKKPGWEPPNWTWKNGSRNAASIWNWR